MADALAQLRAMNEAIDRNVQHALLASSSVSGSNIASRGFDMGYDENVELFGGPSPARRPTSQQQRSSSAGRRRAEMAKVAEERAMAAMRPGPQFDIQAPSSPPRASTAAPQQATPGDEHGGQPSTVGAGSGTRARSGLAGAAAAAGPGMSASSNSRIPTMAKKRTAAQDSLYTAGPADQHLDGGGSRTGNDAPASPAAGAESNIPALGVVDPDLPLEMQVKLLRSHLKTAMHDAREHASNGAKLQRELVEARKEASKAAEERQRLNRTSAAAEAALEKAKKASALAEAREAELRQQLSNLQKDAANSAKVAKSAESSSSAMDVRLARAHDEIERLKAQLTSERTASTDALHAHRKEAETLQLALRKAEKQRADLLLALKKQIKLIDVLKRQKIHMEAARMLAFTEEEFAKIMQAGV